MDDFIPIGKVLHIRKFFGQRLPASATAPVCIDMVLDVIFNEVNGAMLGAGELIELSAHYTAHKFLSDGELAYYARSRTEPAEHFEIAVVIVLH